MKNSKLEKNNITVENLIDDLSRFVEKMEKTCNEVTLSFFMLNTVSSIVEPEDDDVSIKSVFIEYYNLDAKSFTETEEIYRNLDLTKNNNLSGLIICLCDESKLLRFNINSVENDISNCFNFVVSNNEISCNLNAYRRKHKFKFSRKRIRTFFKDVTFDIVVNNNEILICIAHDKVDNTLFKIKDVRTLPKDGRIQYLLVVDRNNIYLTETV